MATAEEILQTMAEVPESAPVCVIDPETRTIIVPPEYQLFGVENDKRTERLYFQCPKIVGDNQDLSRDYQLFINYQNANGDPDAYHIDDMEIDGDNITFSWLLEENVTKYRGNIQFAFGAIIPGDEAEDPDKNRWNTTINTDCTCLVGLKCTQQVAESNPDALVQIWAAIDELKAGGGGSGTPGKDGREIEIQNSGTAIQWKYVGEEVWKDLVQLSEITGATPNLQIGTVQTLEPEQQATASISGTPENPLLNLGIPKGYDGTEEILERTAFLTDAGREEKQSMISFIDDDCRVETYNLLFKQVIEPLSVPYTVSCPPDVLNDLEGQYMTTDQLLEMYSAGVSVSSHHLRQYNMNQFGSSEEYNSDLVSCTQEFKNIGIKDVISVSYPQGIVVDDYINTVKKHYQMGFTVSRGINKIPYESYFMKRCEVFPTNNMYTLEDAKKLVDEVVASGGWLIFMTHAWYSTFNVDTLKELVLYIQDCGVDIVDINTAIKSTGNIMEIGKFQKPLTDMSTPFTVVDSKGAVWTNTLRLVKRSEVNVDIIDVGYHVGYYLTVNGNTMQHSDTLRTISDPVTASAGEVYRLTCSAVYVNALYVIYDSNGGVLEAKQPDSNVAEAINGDTVLTDYEVTMPEGTASFRVSSNRNIQPEGYVIKKIEPVQDDTGEGGILGGDTINVDAELKEYMNVAKPAIASAIINKGGSVEPDDSLGDYATRITAIPNDVYPAETLPEQTNLSASGLQDSVGIKLNWSNVNASGYLILRKENAMPATSADGDIVYNGTYAVDGYTDTGVQKGKVYYYRIFPRNSKNQYQSLEDGAVAMVDYKDRTGQTLLGDLPLGTKIKFGQWNGSDFFWEVVDTQDKASGFVTVAADQNLGSRQFDAPEPNSPITSRKTQGNNRWAYSAVRQLLNSEADTDAWWTAQYEYDAEPSYAAQIPGFLKDFTTYEKGIVVTKTNKCILPNDDGGGSETVQDKFWLPSYYAMALGIVQPLEDDHTYEKFTDNTSRSYQSNYWVRTINGAESASYVRIVNSNGTAINIAANSYNAVRPFCQLPTSAYMTWSDSDEAYVFADDSQRNPSAT